jgi:protoporphyrinogen oxidase
MKQVVIAGAGPAGLTAAAELLRRSDCRPLVFEADTQVGGISKTVEYRGNRMDLGGHRFFSKSDWVMDWWQDILPVSDASAFDEPVHMAYQGQTRAFSPRHDRGRTDGRVLLVRSRLSRIYYRRSFFDYPLKLNVATLRNLGVLEAALLGVSYTKGRLFPRQPENTLEDFFVNRFGDRLYRTFFKDYTEKVWGVPCGEISAEWGAQRIKGLSVTKAIAHALKAAFRAGSDLRQKSTETSLIERFLYPRLGPGQMWETVAERVGAQGGEVHLGQRVSDLRRDGHQITAVEIEDVVTGERRWIPCDAFISTMPLNALVDQLHCEDADVNRVARGLPYRDFMTAGLVVQRMLQRHGTSATPKDNWIYIQEPDVRLGRLQIFNNWSPDLVADPATVSLGLEYFCAEGDAQWRMPDLEFLSMAASELEKIGLIDQRDVLDGTVVRVPKAYPAYFGEYRDIGLVRDYLDTFPNLYAIGRNGMHRYNNQDHSMLAAKAAVDCIVDGSGDKREIWAVNTEEDYHEVRSDGESPIDQSGSAPAGRAAA